MAIPPFRASIDGCSPRLLDFFLVLGHIPASICPWYTQTSPPMSFSAHAMPSEMNPVAEQASAPTETAYPALCGSEVQQPRDSGSGRRLIYPIGLS